MSSFAVLTPSYAPDFELCRVLNQSVLDCTEPEVEHHLVVPRRDRELFSQLASPRTRVWAVDDFLPRRMVPIPTANAWINVRRPYPPVRGWVMQQIVKFAAAAELGVDVLLLADSDVTFVRPMDADTFRIEDHVRLYRADGAVHDGMPRHLLWHDVARRLLGLPAAGPPPLPDYICPMNAWDRRVVLALKDHVEQATGRPWLDAIASQVHVSEFILYGVFVDEVLATREAPRATPATLCHTFWGAGPGQLTRELIPGFVEALPDSDVAVMISSKTHTPFSVREEALAQVRAAVSVDLSARF